MFSYALKLNFFILILYYNYNTKYIYGLELLPVAAAACVSKVPRATQSADTTLTLTSFNSIVVLFYYHYSTLIVVTRGLPTWSIFSFSSLFIFFTFPSSFFPY